MQSNLRPLDNSRSSISHSNIESMTDAGRSKPLVASNKVAPTHNDPSSPRRKSLLESQAEKEAHAKMTKEMQERVNMTKSKMSGIYDPRTSKFLPQWDMIVGLALLFTATVTPYEVAFLGVAFDLLFVFNRIMDCVFSFDIYVQFHLAFYDSERRAWVIDRREIAWNYAKTWLLLDIISTIPYDIIDVVVRETSTSAPGEESAASQLKVLRVLKILKLVKLLRILKSARIFITIQRELGLSNANSSLIKFLATFVAFIHWIACIWGLGPQFESEGSTWYEKWGHQTVENKLSGGEKYVLCIYTSVQMMVMGEAEDTRPGNTFEYSLAVVCMIVGGSVYAYVIGSICSIISVRDPAKKEFKDMCDLVAQFSHEHSLPPITASQVHDYFRESEQLFRGYAYSKVVGRMAPSLRKTIAVHIHGESLYKIWFFNSDDHKERTEFTAAVALSLTPCAFPPNELLYSAGHLASFMAIVVRGLANQSSDKVGHMRQLGKGASFGEEMILSRSLRPDSVRAITYLNCNKLERDDLMRLLSESHGAFPHTVHLIRKATCKLALRRAVASVARMCRLMRMTKHTSEGREHSGSWEKKEVAMYKKSLLRTAEEKTKAAMAAQAKMRISVRNEKGEDADVDVGVGVGVVQKAGAGAEKCPVKQKAETALKKASHQLAHFTSPQLVMHLVRNVEHMESNSNGGPQASGPPLSAFASMDLMDGDGEDVGTSSSSSASASASASRNGNRSSHRHNNNNNNSNNFWDDDDGDGDDDANTNTNTNTNTHRSGSNDGGGGGQLIEAIMRMEQNMMRMQHQIEAQGNVLRALHRDTQDLKTKL